MANDRDAKPPVDLWAHVEELKKTAKRYPISTNTPTQRGTTFHRALGKDEQASGHGHRW
jgi:hypothetical protein